MPTDKNLPPASSVNSPNSQTTLKGIAHRTGVSVITISRVLSGQADRYRISKETETAVRKLAKELDFVPNQLARGLRLKKTLGTHKHGYSVILCDTQDSTELEIKLLSLLQSRNVEGIILCPVGQTHEHLTEFINGKLPMVLVDRFFPDLPISYVSSDNVTGATQATELLISNGHRQMACLQGLRGTSPNEFRVRGYKEALARHHTPVDESLIVGDSFTEQSGYIETKLLLKTRPDVTALLALCNFNALGAVRALAEEKRRVPEDISIVSFDNPPYAAYLATPMTSVAQSYSEMGEVAVKLLFDQIQSNGGKQKGGILLPTQLIRRKSVKRLELQSN